MESQHELIAGELENASAALPTWRATAGVTVRDRLAAALERLQPLLVEHLAAEEQEILPLAARVLTQEEWDELGERGMAGIPRSKMPMVFGMLMADGDPEVLRAMIAHAPLVPRLVVPRIAPRALRPVHPAGVRDPAAGPLTSDLQGQPERDRGADQGERHGRRADGAEARRRRGGVAPSTRRHSRLASDPT